MEVTRTSQIYAEKGEHSMIQVNWMAATTVVVIGALLTALLAYVTATVGRSTDRRPGVDARQDGAHAHDWGRTAATERRPAA